MGAKSKAKAEADATLIPQGATADELTANCPDLEQWPRSWMYEERDLSHGQQMVECFKPFLRHLVSSGQSHKTVRSHRDNLWILGGEIISKLHEDPQLRKRPTDQLSGYGHVDDARALPTCPQPQQQIQKPNQG
jgi:hypothetical protein